MNYYFSSFATSSVIGGWNPSLLKKFWKYYLPVRFSIALWFGAMTAQFARRPSIMWVRYPNVVTFDSHIYARRWKKALSSEMEKAGPFALPYNRNYQIMFLLFSFVLVCFAWRQLPHLWRALAQPWTWREEYTVHSLQRRPSRLHQW